MLHKHIQVLLSIAGKSKRIDVSALNSKSFIYQTSYFRKSNSQCLFVIIQKGQIIMQITPVCHLYYNYTKHIHRTFKGKYVWVFFLEMGDLFLKRLPHFFPLQRQMKDSLSQLQNVLLKHETCFSSVMHDGCFISLEH